ncbi:MAG: hypothetical protein GAK35_02822 [Herbaspirillum frisingense]|uniref:Uncharacterized protein n=1 Tax=Herbaspirillum frisingense TaxID=92645 RepID=A0A7V8JTP3_9BURK|nr:MAG: hypothetical protein GAK35_02822 [Herbaspirillum frisingense]
MHSSPASDDDLETLGSYLALLRPLMADFDSGDTGADAPELPQAAFTPEDQGWRPPDRAGLAALEGDAQMARMLESLREDANRGFSDLVGQALQWIPARAARATAPNLQMGNVMELRDLMAASRRNLGGGEGSADERRHAAHSLSLAGAVNLAQPLWNPTDAASYASLDEAAGSNLLVNLLMS